MRCDLHLHSRHSNRSAEWLFRRFGFPDSYSEPRQLLTKLGDLGMDCFTLTDHNTIDGCLEIAAEPGVFLSEEVTTYFPDDHCKVHLLVWNLTEAQHADVFKLRENIYELQAYLARTGLVHAVAHPFYSLNQTLHAAHVEKLILLFKHFEVRNGLRDALLSELAEHVLTRLTPAQVETFANRHGLEPTHPEPWHKFLVAGSDDHGGLYPAVACTETPAGVTPADFLEHVRAGRTRLRGDAGTPLILSHGLYNTVFKFAKDRVRAMQQTPLLLEKMFSRFMEGENPTEFTFTDKMNFLAQGVLSGQVWELIKPANASFWGELSAYFSQPEVKAAIARQTTGVLEPERRAFLIANLFANQLAYRFFTKFVGQIRNGSLAEGLQAISALVPIGVLLSPYLYAFQSQAPDRGHLRVITRELTGEVAPPLRNHKRAWLTDTLEDVNGVSTTIQKMSLAGRAAGYGVTVVTSRAAVNLHDLKGIPLKNFPPIGEFEIPEYELQKLTFPPILEILDYLQRERFTELIISTPGPIGLVGLLAAKMFKLRTVGIYHTDFPQYVQILSEDHFWESLAWRYMYWFYGQVDLLYVNSAQYRSIWMERGIDGKKIKIFPRGLDTALFRPDRRDPRFWTERGAGERERVLLYVGRVSLEKNLDVFAAAHDLLRARGWPVRAAVVGDGIYAKELRRLLPDGIFTGYLGGEELARAYASADAFVFPSVTDTFGNVVLEAQASGLPVVVTDQKGPQELVEDGVTGFICRGLDAADTARAVEELLRDPGLRERVGQAARHQVEGRSWAAAFAKFWAASEE